MKVWILQKSVWRYRLLWNRFARRSRIFGGFIRLTTFVVGATVAVGLLSGCAPTETLPSPGPVNPQTEMFNNFAACMQDLGWDAEVTGDSVTVPDVPEEQDSQYKADYAKCLPELQQIDPSTFSDSEWARSYAIAIEAADCLKALGYEVDAPSRQKYQEDGGGWNPYIHLIQSGEMSNAEFLKAEPVCPQPKYFPDRK